MNRFAARFFTAAKVHATPTAGVVVASLVMLIAPASVSLAGGFELRKASVGPADAYFAGRPLTIRFRAADDRERFVRVAIVNKRTRKSVHDWRLATFGTLTEYPLRWRGKSAGRIAPNGRYVVRAGPDGRPLRRIGGFKWRRHAYPVAGPHSSRGYLGEFGAPRNGGRTHEGFDILSPCGTPLVAARGGRVRFSGYHGAAGNYLVIDGKGTGFDTAYMHLLRPSLLRTGDQVRTGQPIGLVGSTGSSTACHLHFEMWTAPGWYEGGSPIDPLSHLLKWDRYS